MKLQRDPTRCWWRRNLATGGDQLSTGLWWVAYCGKSEQSPGRFYWKLSPANNDPRVCLGYCDSMEEARREIETRIKDDPDYDYFITDTAGTNQLAALADALGKGLTS